MSTPILATKLYIPQARTKLVRRGRLVKLLDQGLHRKLTLVSAPAGFGKTTVVSEWVADCGQATAWLSLDEGDNDPIRFLTYFVAALQTITPTIGEGVLATLQSTQVPIEPILTVLLNEIATLSDNFLFVLDDYHLIDTKIIDNVLNFVLEHLPLQMHLVIASREDPNLPLARLRARSQLTELRVSDLRFASDEAAEFLNQLMGLELSSEDITALDRRTEGWIAGLQLAAISMQGHQDISSFIESFTGSHHFVLDYLLEEVLHQQSASVQKFLLHTSILDRLCGSLCDAILLDPAVSGQATLEYIEHANLFIIPLDSERRWYRYHHLFADLLRQRLLQNHASSTVAEIAEFHRRASLWYEDNDLPADAIHHALAAKDFARAAGLIELAWPAMDGSFQSATWLAWAQALPDDLVHNRPVLSVAYGWALLNKGELEPAELRFLDAEACLTAAEKLEQIEASSPEMKGQMVIVDQKQFRTLTASIATARAYASQARGDITHSIKYGLQALKLLPKDDYLRRGPAAALLALSQWASGDLEDAYQTLAEAMANFQKIGSLHFAISGTYGLADIKISQGKLREAIEIYSRTLQLALAQGKSLLRGTADLYLGLSDLYREQGAMDAAIQNLLQSEALGEESGLADWRYRFCRTQARFKETQGDMTGALALLDEAEKHFRRTPVPDLRPITALRTRVWLAQGNLSQALRWVEEMELSVNDKLSYLHEFEHITLARVLLAEYRRNQSASVIHELLNLLNRLLQAAQAGKRTGGVIEIGILQALTYQSQAKLDSALLALERSLRLAEPEGYMRIFLDEGIQMAQLLSEAAAQGIMPNYTAKLLAAFEAEQQSKEGKSTRRTVVASQPLIEPLSERELEILQLIAQGLSNREISEKLYLALDTVKGYNGRIFAKLAVQRRTEAVARARDLGLLEV
jgi:LuxR family maltose regulon positive regulatory protein